MSHDDVYYPNKVEAQIKFFGENEDENVVLYSDYDIIDSKSKFQFRRHIKHIEPDRLQFAILISRPIHGCTVLIHKNIFHEIGMFNENLLTVQDYEMWYRIARNFKFIHLNEALIKIRVHSDQGIFTINTHELEGIQFYLNCLKKIPVDEMRRISGDKSAASAYSKLAIKYKKRIVSPASLYASRLAKKYLFDDDIFTVIKNMTLIIYCDLCNLAFKILNKTGFAKPKSRNVSKTLKNAKKP